MTFAQPFPGYEILAKLGSGAMGTVFKARQKKMGRIVALKVLRPSLARNKRFVERLRREARIVGSLSHPNIVAGYDLGEEGGYHFFVMELVTGSSLKQLLAEWGMFPEEQVLDVAIQVSEALDHAFQRGVIHRDIKPGNILIDEESRVKLTDMGLAKGPTDVTLTRDGATVGTPQYISPEQARNPQEVDVRSDLYSLGATLFHMATGSPPFRGESIGELITKVLTEREPWAQELNPLLSDGLNLVIRKLLAKDPELRYQDPADLLEDLRRVQRAEDPAVDPRYLESPPARRSPWQLVTGLAALAVLTPVLTWQLWPESSEEQQELSPNQAFREGLRKSVTQAASYREKFAAVQRFQATAQNSIQAEMSQDERADLTADLSQELRRYLDDYLDEERIAWLEAPENWRDTRERFVDALQRDIQLRFGYLPASLPPTARASIDPPMARLVRQVDDLVQGRNQLYLQGYTSNLRDLKLEVDRHLTTNDLAAAERSLEEMLQSYHGQQGRPGLEQLPDDLIAAVERERDYQSERLNRRLGLRRNALATTMREEVAEDLASLGERLAAGSDPRRVLRDLQDMRAELERHYPGPEDFEPIAENPWPEVDRKIESFKDEIRRELRFLDQDLLAEDLRQAYRSLLLEGDARATIELLRNRSLTEELLVEERIRHVDLLTAAVIVRDTMFAAILNGRQRAAMPLQGGGRVELRQLPDESFTIITEDSEGERPVQLVHLDIEQLFRSLGPDFESRVRSRGLTEGLAFWQFVAGARRNLALSLLPDLNMRRFFSDDLRPLIDEIRGQASELENAAAVAMTSLRQAVENQDLRRAKQSLEQFVLSYSETKVARSNRRNLRQLAQWVESESRRQELLAGYRQQAPAGVELQVDADLLLRLDYPLASLRAPLLPEGWRPAADHLELEADARTLTRSIEQALEFPTLLNGDQSYEVTLRFRIPGDGSHPQMLVLAADEVWAALGLLPSSDKAFAALGSGAVQDSATVMRSEFSRSLGAFETSPPCLVPGGIQELALRFEVRRNRVHVSIALEGRELARSDFPLRAVGEPSLRLIPLQGIELYSLRLRQL